MNHQSNSIKYYYSFFFFLKNFKLILEQEKDFVLGERERERGRKRRRGKGGGEGERALICCPLIYAFMG